MDTRMRVESEDPRGPRTIKEGFSPRAVEAFMANYRDPQLAFLDLVDNAIDNRIEGEPLVVRVTIASNQLSISNQGGEGLNFEGLQNYFLWGHSDKIGKIGQFGVGGKSAMGFLARSIELTCSPIGSDEEYTVVDPDWENRDEGLREYEVPEKKAATKDGYFRLRLTNLKKDINSTSIIARLGDIYRPLLLDSSIKITVNNRQVQPLEIKYLESDQTFKPQGYNVHTRLGDKFLMKVGILEEGQRVKPGIRCYYHGRLIEEEQFFGHPTPAIMPQSSRLIGEAHLDFVPVTPNKSNFIRGSVEWESASVQIKHVLEPWIQKLAKLRIEQSSPVEGYEKELAKKAKRIMEHVLAVTGLVSKGELPGESFGRLPPSPREDPRQITRKKRIQKKTREGQTAPLIQATVGETVKRWGAMFNWDVISMGTYDKRGEIIEEDGKTVLKINSDYPLYQAAKKAGEAALEIYMAESAAMKICEMVTRGKSIEEYVELLNQMLSSCGEMYKSRISSRRKA